MRHGSVGHVAAAFVALTLSIRPAAAQNDVADFYRSKGLTLQVGGEAGGAYARQDYGRPFFTPPDVPAARLAALRTAFERVFKDEAFQDDVRKQKLDLNFVPPQTLADMTDKVMASPPEVVERLHKVLGF